jgi:hypothetical protein
MYLLQPSAIAYKFFAFGRVSQRPPPPKVPDLELRSPNVQGARHVTQWAKLYQSDCNVVPQ